MLLISACSSIPDRVRDEQDPFERLNRSVYAFNTTVDEEVIAPINYTQKIFQFSSMSASVAQRTVSVWPNAEISFLRIVLRISHTL